MNHPKLDVHYTDNENNTLLHYAIRGMLDALSFGKNEGPYSSTIENDFMIEVINQLLTKGANPTIKNNFGKTPLEYALQESGRVFMKYPKYYKGIISQKIIDLLLDAEHNFNSQKKANGVS